jgi:hypothetical protein
VPLSHFLLHLLLFWVKLIISTWEFLSPSIIEGINNGPSSLDVTSSIYPRASVLNWIPGATCSTAYMTWGNRLNSRSYRDPFQDLLELHHPLHTLSKCQDRGSWCDWPRTLQNLWQYDLRHLWTWTVALTTYRPVFPSLEAPGGHNTSDRFFIWSSPFFSYGIHLSKTRLPLSSNMDCCFLRDGLLPSDVVPLLPQKLSYSFFIQRIHLSSGTFFTFPKILFLRFLR